MKSVAGHAAVLLGAYLLFVLIQLPAGHAYYWLDPGRQAPVALYQIDGSIWSGEARTAVIAGTAVGPLSWSLRPWALVLGRVELHLTVDHNDGGRLEAIAGRTLGGEVYLRDATLAMSLNELASLAGQQDMGLTGRLDADIRSAAVKGELITRAEGRAEITDAGIGPPIDVRLGAFTIDIETSGDVIRAKIADAGGPLQTEGVLLLNPDGSYRLNAGFTPRDPGSPDGEKLMDALRMVGRPAGRGKVTVTRQGKLELGGL